MKKALIIANVYDFLNFLTNDIEILKSLGYEVHCATNMEQDEWLRDKGTLDYLGIIKHNIPFGRTPFELKNIAAYKKIKKLIKEYGFSVIHCHTPVAAAIGRIAAISARKKGAKVLYTCHGFHFHKTSPIKDWLLYYPMEYLLALFTDGIITINREDYTVIKKFKVRYKRYIPGVGVEINRFRNNLEDGNLTRKKLGIPQDAFLIVSIGELSDRKNQSVIIKAMSKLKSCQMYYVICGEGNKREEYEHLAKMLGVESRVKFMGQLPYDDIIKICQAADIGAFPSKIEGLGLAGIELMAAGKPLVASNVHGIVDYAIEGLNSIICDPLDITAFAKGIYQLYKDRDLRDRYSVNAIKIIKKFSKENSYRCLEHIYKEIIE